MDLSNWLGWGISWGINRLNKENSVYPPEKKMLHKTTILAADTKEKHQ